MPAPRFASIPAPAFAFLLLAACAGTPERPAPHAAPMPETHTTSSTSLANDVLFRAIGLVGTPYRFGGNTPTGGFDCSGLVGYVFREAAGLALPRQSQAIAGLEAPRVARDRLAPGDLVFFGARQVSHIGIYVGEGRFVHAPSSGGTVRMDRLDGHYWKEHYLYAKRVLR